MVQMIIFRMSIMILIMMMMMMMFVVVVMEQVYDGGKHRKRGDGGKEVSTLELVDHEL